MKLYVKTRNKFLKISVVILIVALFVIFKCNNEALGNFLLGIFASTFIVAIQSDLSVKVEESKLLIEKLRIVRDLCYEFREFKTFSVDYFSLDFEKKFKDFRKILNNLFKINNELGNVGDLNKKTKISLKKITDKISSLEIELHFIFKEFEKQNTKMKIIYFMEFYKILKKFDFDELKSMVSELGWNIDSNEFYKSDFIENKNWKITKMEYDTSLKVYNKKIEDNNLIEYKALKKEFERFLK